MFENLKDRYLFVLLDNSTCQDLHGVLRPMRNSDIVGYWMLQQRNLSGMTIVPP
jgi:hypothetical protein